MSQMARTFAFARPVLEKRVSRTHKCSLVARIQLGSRTALVALLFCSLMALVSANRAVARGASPQAASATSVNVAKVPTTHEVPEPEEHGLSQKPDEITHFLNFPITNSMIVSWIVGVGLLVFAQLATRSMKPVPNGAQNLLEWLIEGLYKFIESIIGPHLTARTFWFFATIFIFILAANWLGLVPGVGTIGWGHQTAHGFKIDHPLFRGANADVNMTLAMALVFFALWFYWSLSEDGLWGFLKELFGPKGETSGFLKWPMLVVFFAAGCLEIVSILFRPVSLTFRLYGNIFAGENMLDTMAKLIPGLGWLLQIPFYFLELLMGLVQAMVFMLLTAVFTFLMCQQEEGAAPAHE
jgi:F-type H+-transporting ATPase subunit a